MPIYIICDFITVLMLREQIQTCSRDLSILHKIKLNKTSINAVNSDSAFIIRITSSPEYQAPRINGGTDPNTFKIARIQPRSRRKISRFPATDSGGHVLVNVPQI